MAILQSSRSSGLMHDPSASIAWKASSLCTAIPLLHPEAPTISETAACWQVRTRGGMCVRGLCSRARAGISFPLPLEEGWGEGMPAVSGVLTLIKGGHEALA
jgi:hypothetical protein